MTQFSGSARPDAAGDAAQLLSRIGYAVLALAAPSAVILSTRSIFVLYPIGVALLLVAAALDPTPGVPERFRAVRNAPVTWVTVGLLAWAALSVLWSPFPASGAQLLLKIVTTAIAALFVIATAREHLRATDLYLFPIGVLLAMVTILGLWFAVLQGIEPDTSRIHVGGVVLVVMVFPAMAGLAARGRNGYTRAMMVLALVYAFALGAPATAAALLVGFAVLSFAVSDTRRTVNDLSWVAGGLILIAPLVVAITPTLSHWLFHAKLANLGAPYPTFAAAASLILHDVIRLFTGHGIDTVVRGVESGVLPAMTPRVVVFEIWYELGIVGAIAASVATWMGFRAIGNMAPRLAPYVAATFACDLTLGFLAEDLTQMTWVTL
ncbi:MAG: hypothetical protein JO234_12270, partial [Hyphomicrobiales bacterium]|nr:hypothetical protein [Hyphomicrobiales bacterium]